MPDFLDFMERATSGRFISPNDFDMKVLIPSVARIVKSFDIKYEPENPVTSNDELADRLFQGAVELLVQTGIYCNDTNRIIQPDRKEIIKAACEFPGESFFGEDRDRRVFRFRKPEEDRLPWFHVGTGTVASSEEIAMAQVEGYGSISQANSISIPAFGHVRGMAVLGNSPFEIYAAVNSVQAGRKALLNCGRPGLPIMNLISSATSSMSTIAGSYPAFGLRPSDGWLIDFIAEMKINFESLNRLAFILITGGNIGSVALPILGGYAGGPEGTALIMTAYYLLGILLFKGSYHLTGPLHFRHGCSTTRDSLWVFSISGRATSRNITYPAIALGYASAGPCTKMYFYEAAAINLCCVTSGYGGVQTVHPAKAVVIDGVTPLEARFNVETACAATGMKAGRANEIVMRLLERYEKDIENAPQGKRYQECFDLQTRKPHKDYIRLYNEVKEELAEIGIPY